MKKVLGCIRRADEDFEMIQPGDRVAVGVSGGKDSLLLLKALALYRRFSGKEFELEGLMLTMGFEPFDDSNVRAMCEEIGVPLTVKPTEIGPIVFNERREKNPCALCAKMRRGALNILAAERGCNKLAHTFQPVTHLSRSGLTVIRPMVYLPEKDIIHEARVQRLPVVKNPCPADGHTARQDMKELLTELTKRYPFVRERLLSALKNKEQYGLWDKNGPATRTIR